MNAKITIDMGGEDFQRKAELFIQMAKRSASFVLEHKTELGGSHFWAIGPAPIIHAYGLKDEELLVKIRSELDPLEADIGKKLGEGEYDLVLDLVEPVTIRNMPERIRHELERSQTRTCPSCMHKVVPVDFGIIFCPYCGRQLEADYSDELTICQKCPSDKNESMLYHHSYKNCPKCGRKLQRLNTEAEDFFVCDDEFFIGVRLADVELPPNAIPPKPKAK
jgi:hypothetical protein